MRTRILFAAAVLLAVFATPLLSIGIGGGCPMARFCNSNSQCTFGAIHGACVNNVCRC
ncbi:MAG TPA: hypothetical protein VF173_12725 [Thermoanaerobaculia bacterium]|nr:hypothetical protein [Thermoanaerobaculia bacterium]